MKKSRISTKIQALFALLIIVALLAMRAVVLTYEGESGFRASQPPWTQIIKEEGPGLKSVQPNPGEEVLKEEGPGLRGGWPPFGVQIVKEEGPGLRGGCGGRSQGCSREGPQRWQPYLLLARWPLDGFPTDEEAGVECDPHQAVQR